MFVLILNPRSVSRVYYYFYERSREAILRSKPDGGKALNTAESVLIGLIAGKLDLHCAIPGSRNAQALLQR